MLLKKNHMLNILLDQMMPAMRQGIYLQGENLPEAEYKNLVSQKLRDLNSRQKEEIFCFLSGGEFNLLSYWLEYGATASAAEMGAIAERAVSAFACIPGEREDYNHKDKC